MDTRLTVYLIFNQFPYSNNCILKVISGRINSCYLLYLRSCYSNVFSHGLWITLDIKVQIIRLSKKQFENGPVVAKTSCLCRNVNYARSEGCKESTATLWGEGLIEYQLGSLNGFPLQVWNLPNPVQIIIHLWQDKKGTKETRLKICFFLLNLSAFGFRQVCDSQSPKLGAAETPGHLISRGWGGGSRND